MHNIIVEEIKFPIELEKYCTTGKHDTNYCRELPQVSESCMSEKCIMG